MMNTKPAHQSTYLLNRLIAIFAVLIFIYVSVFSCEVDPYVKTKNDRV